MGDWSRLVTSWDSARSLGRSVFFPRSQLGLFAGRRGTGGGGGRGCRRRGRGSGRGSRFSRERLCEAEPAGGHHQTNNEPHKIPSCRSSVEITFWAASASCIRVTVLAILLGRSPAPRLEGMSSRGDRRGTDPRRIKLFCAYVTVARKVARITHSSIMGARKFAHQRVDRNAAGAVEVIQCWLRTSAGYSEKLLK